MKQSVSDVAIGSIVIDGGDPAPKFLQLYRQIRSQIASGVWKEGAKLPSTRALAADLGLSRNTVITAYEQLEAEGYVETASGARASVLPLPVVDAHAGDTLPSLENSLSKRGQGVVGLRHQTGFPGGYMLQPGLPDAREFPFAAWRRLVTRHLRLTPGESFGYHSYGGHQRLREVIAQYMQSSRGVKCEAGQIMVTAGAQAAFNLLAHMLIDAGDPVMIEEPGYTGAHGAFVAAGARLVPLSVAGRHWNLDDIVATQPKLIYLTPSCQFPLGTTMRIEQRMQVVELAARVGAWLIEDDFDSEFRFHSSHVPTLQFHDSARRTIYVGSFAKTMLPDLRLGFIIFPGEVDKLVRKANFLMGTAAPLATQAALADFIHSGAFARHTRRMKRIYAGRRSLLLEHCHALFGDCMEQLDEGNGLQTTWRFHQPADDVAIAEDALRLGVSTTPLSVHYFHGAPEHGLTIGYAATDEKQIARALGKLNGVIRGWIG